jgi:GMC oxidoreductase
MCSTTIHARTQMHLINSGAAQITYIEQHRLLNQIRQRDSYCSEAPSGLSRPASYLEYSQETASAPFMNRCGDVLLASDLYRQDGTRFHVGRRRKLKVYGIENLRIADGSIMPRVTTGNTMAACVIIGERAGEILKADHQL